MKTDKHDISKSLIPTIYVKGEKCFDRYNELSQIKGCSWLITKLQLSDIPRTLEAKFYTRNKASDVIKTFISVRVHTLLR